MEHKKNRQSGASKDHEDPVSYLLKIREKQVENRKLIFKHPIYGEYVVSKFTTAVMFDTFEFNRLHYIKQANLQYLVRPSATHTRANHIIGSLFLLREALNNIYSNIQKYYSDQNEANGITRKIKRFEKHLELALLLHDIGVPPFSHVLEPLLKQEAITKIFKNYKIDHKDIDHEDIALKLIDGSEDDVIAKAFEEFFNDNFLKKLGIDTVHNKLNYLVEKKELNKDDIKIIKYMIKPQKNESLINYLDDSEKSLVKALTELINSLWDIDRAEHVMSDIYYTEFTTFKYNLTNLLRSYIIAKNNQGKFVMAIIDKQLFHIMSLLLTRLEIKREIWSDPNVRGYEAMLQQALKSTISSSIVNKKNVDFKKFFTWTDEYLMQNLSNNGSDISSKIAKQLLWRSQMFELVYEIPISYEIYKKYRDANIIGQKIIELDEKREELVEEIRKLKVIRSIIEKIKSNYPEIPYISDLPYIYLPPERPDDYRKLINDKYIFDSEKSEVKNFQDDKNFDTIKGFIQAFNAINYRTWNLRIYVPQFMKNEFEENKNFKKDIYKVIQDKI